jgi:hypothetical protein
VKGKIFNNMLYMQYVRLIKHKHIQKQQAHPLVREDVTQGLLPQEFSCRKEKIQIMYLKGLKRFRNDWRQTARRKATLTDHSD